MTDIVFVRNHEIRMRDVLPTIARLQAEHPDMEIFVDGDQKAIVGRCKA